MAYVSVNKATIIWLMCTWMVWDITYSKRILILCPLPVYSHYTSSRPIWHALSKRGHDITIVTAFPQRTSNLSNYKEIHFSFLTELVSNINFVDLQRIPHVEQIRVYEREFLEALEALLNQTEVRELYAAEGNHKFDAVILEMYFAAGLGLLAHRFNAPLIGISTGAIGHSYRYSNGNPILFSHPSNWEFENNVGFGLTLWQRLFNMVRTWRILHESMVNFYDKQQSIMEKYLGKNIPHIRDILKNMSLILSNQNPVLTYAVPDLPNIVYYSNLHIVKKPPPLPNDLNTFLANATNGFIYVNFGSTVKSKHLPKEILDMFVRVFSTLPYKIVWKFEGDELIGKPDNVFTSKWIAQQSVLAHPKIKLFIYQGGYQSTEEAVYNAVPLIGIPFFADQNSIVRKMESLGVAKYIEYPGLTSNIIENSIWQLLNDNNYKMKMIKLRELAKDTPYDKLENVIWWIEFVMRHKGAPHLRYSGADEPWYQRNDADIIAFLAVCFFLIICSLGVIIIYTSSRVLKCSYFKWLNQEKKKDVYCTK